MTIDVDKVQPGIYLVFWKNTNLVSRAVIFLDRSGTRMFQCHHWISDNNDVILEEYLDGIEKLVFIM